MRRIVPAIGVLLLAAACSRGPAETETVTAAGPVSTPAEPSAATGDNPGGAGDTVSPPPLQGGTDDWTKVATDQDRARVAALDQMWGLALDQARAGSFAGEIEHAGAELDPKAGVAGRIQPTPGDYACRLYKLGQKQGGQGVAYVTYPDFRCSVDLTPGGDLVLTKLTGSQRTKGLIYPDNDRRGIFIGAQAWGEERDWPAYGEINDRDQIGVVERIGPKSWRVMFPQPRQDSLLDVLVLEP